MSERRILLTGGTGYLGSLLAHKLCEQGCHVTILKPAGDDVSRIADIIGSIQLHDWNPSEPASVFDVHGPFDTIIHCATDYGRGHSSIVKIANCNLMLPLALLDVSDHCGQAEMFINIDTILSREVNPYARTKKQFKEWLHTYRDRKKCINIAFEQFYGPKYTTTQFVNYLINAFTSGTESIDLTAGEQFRDFLYVGDAVQAIMCVLNHAYPGPGEWNYEVSGGDKRTIREMVELLQRVCGNTTTELNFGARQYRDNELMDVLVDTHAIREIGWSPTVNLEEGFTAADKISFTPSRNKFVILFGL